MRELQWPPGGSGPDGDRFFRSHRVLILGAVGATLLGVLTALELEVFVAAGRWFLNLGGRDGLVRTAATAGLTGLMLWILCAIVTRAIARATLKPYQALADHFERLGDGEVDSHIVLQGEVPEARRLARAVSVFHQRALSSERSKARLQARYDSLYREHADERRLLIGMLTGARPEVKGHPSVTRSDAAAVSPANLDAERTRCPRPEAFPSEQARRALE